MEANQLDSLESGAQKKASLCNEGKEMMLIFLTFLDCQFITSQEQYGLDGSNSSLLTNTIQRTEISCNSLKNITRYNNFKQSISKSYYYYYYFNFILVVETNI